MTTALSSASPKLKFRIKVCGITRLEDAYLCSQLGAWALGFVFYKQSSRYIQPERVLEIVTQLKSKGLHNPLFCGVFVNCDFDELVAIVRKAQLDVVQLHGDENPDFCHSLKKVMPGVQIIKALRPSEFTGLNKIGLFHHCDAVLLDSFHENLYGGSGISLSENILSAAVGMHPKIIVAGGLNIQNIKKAYSLADAFAADLSSSLESSPGVKNSTLLHNLFSEIEAAHEILE